MSEIERGHEGYISVTSCRGFSEWCPNTHALEPELSFTGTFQITLAKSFFLKNLQEQWVWVGDRRLTAASTDTALHSYCECACDEIWPQGSVSFSSSVKWAKVIEGCTIGWIIMNRILGIVAWDVLLGKGGGYYCHYCCHHRFTPCKFQYLCFLILIFMLQVLSPFAQRSHHLFGLSHHCRCSVSTCGNESY